MLLVDVDEKKLGIARDMGFSTINPGEGDPVEKIFEITENEGADFAVEACGLPLTYRQALQSVCLQGEVVFLGNLSGDLSLSQKDVSTMLRKEITIYGTWNSKIVPAGIDDWSTALEYMDRELVVAPLISHTPLLRDGARVFERILGKKEFYNKVIFKFGE